MIKTLSPDEVRVNGRHRIDVGDIDALAKSIGGRGLLHPIVVTSDHRLICGYRRLMAVRQLGWTKVDVRVVDPDDLLLAERDENEVRKDFTPSERVAIARAIEEKLGKRQGRRSDPPISQNEPVANGPQVEPGEKSRDVAAKAAGFDSPGSYRRAAKVVDHGIPELVEAVDSGQVKVSAAAAVASLPPEEQKPVVVAGPAAIKAKAKEVRRERSAPKPIRDPLNRALGEILILVGSVNAADDDEQHGWGGVEGVYREMDPKGRHHAKELVDHLAGELQGWAEIMRRVDSERG